MRRVNLVLLATLQLCGARTHGFTIHEDLLMHPQFEVLFNNEFISEKDAQALIERNDLHSTYSADFAQATIGGLYTEGNTDNENGEEPETAHSYEVMKLASHRYLCSIPVLQPPPPENKTANELAKAEEARELSRATESGWQLLADLDTTCLYFMSGWWSYSFCNNQQIVQFHALPTIPDGRPPVPDPKMTEFVLGSKPAVSGNGDYPPKQNGAEGDLPAELQVKGDRRYLIQRLDGGTICDLTGRERTIEVQYHCVPGMKGDRIGWIKEVTICAYVMVINTPRLCDDVAFLPPQETKANPINCQLIVDDDAMLPFLEQRQASSEESVSQGEQEKTTDVSVDEAQEKEPITIGGVVVGARHVLSAGDQEGRPPLKLSRPRSEAAKREKVFEVVAQGASAEDGGQVRMLSADELKKLDIDESVVQEMGEEMKKLAGEKGWKLEVVELPGGHLRELRGYVDGEEEPEAAYSDEETESGDESKGKEEGEGSEEKFKQDV
ncbi:hypothetical protein G7046_g1972 [Stylonectria norvegica]|nr:hypothetical protein G7046_g1972 [Stylonectria norvegica]